MDPQRNILAAVNVLLDYWERNGTKTDDTHYWLTKTKEHLEESTEAA